ncbi:unnamed protein product [Effrenium voratum]|nr:unnamed protein product [Effrenium voratum]
MSGVTEEERWGQWEPQEDWGPTHQEGWHQPQELQQEVTGGDGEEWWTGDRTWQQGPEPSASGSARDAGTTKKRKSTGNAYELRAVRHRLESQVKEVGKLQAVVEREKQNTAYWWGLYNETNQKAIASGTHLIAENERLTALAKTEAEKAERLQQEVLQHGATLQKFTRANRDFAVECQRLREVVDRMEAGRKAELADVVTRHALELARIEASGTSSKSKSRKKDEGS